MAKQSGFIVYPDNVGIDGKTFVRLFGRLESGKSFACINLFEPYFFIKESDSGDMKKFSGDFRIESTKSTNFSGEKVSKIIFQNQAELNKFSKELHENDIQTFESDVKPEYRFIIDNDLLGGIEIEGDSESEERVDCVFHDAKIKPCEVKVSLKIASIDIESGLDGKLFCIGIYSESVRKVFMVDVNKQKNKINDVVNCEDEEDCLKKFRDEIVSLDPDIITGWNVIDFDLNFLKDVFAKNKVPFDFGRTNENITLRIEDNFFRSSKADVSGRIVLDGLGLIRDPFIKEAPSIKNIKFENYTLNEVAQQIVGKGKLISGDDRGEEIERLFNGDAKDREKLAKYNLKDCELVFDILNKTKMIELAIERSELTGMPLDRLTSSIASFDSLYIREARKRGLVSPTTRFNQKDEKVKGAFVMSPKSGLYHNVLVLDFKSLYPSILKTFNIDPSSLLDKKIKGAIESPNGVYFKNQDGILPQIIERLHQARELAKKEKRELSSYAIKIIMNSFWGVLASPNCRYFNFAMANAITSFARTIIQLTASEIEKMGFRVIYGDTDSIFISTGLDRDKSEKLGLEISDKIDKFYEDYVKKNYDRKSYLDLEFDKLYLALLMPKTRLQLKDEDEGKGAKKRYAGLLAHAGVSPDGQKVNKEVLDIVGLEAIRGDWTDAAQEFQKELLIKIFKQEDCVVFIKNRIKEIREGKLNSKLVYRKSIRKDLKDYTKMTPPHVKAARKLDRLDGNVIEYYITLDGPEPIQKLKHKIDYEHYVEKQIKPIAKTILDTMGLDFESILEGNKQKKLF